MHDGEKLNKSSQEGKRLISHTWPFRTMLTMSVSGKQNPLFTEW